MQPGDERQMIEILRAEVRDLKADLYGDASRRLVGLIAQFEGMREEMAALRVDLGKLLAWRDQVLFLMRVGVGVMSAGGLAQVIALVRAFAEG